MEEKRYCKCNGMPKSGVLCSYVITGLKYCGARNFVCEYMQPAPAQLPITENTRE